MIKTHKPYYPLYEDKEHFIYLITGGRGCERPDQEVIMHDLSVKQIKDIKIGDKVMGDDGTPRTVLNTYHGFGKMYEVWQSNGETYHVNDGHILTLFHIGRCRRVDIPILEYLCLSEREKVMLRGCNTSHDLSSINVRQAKDGEWYGICLDGNQRYVHSDGTITHNSGKSFSAGTFIERLTFEYNKVKKIAHQILFTRYTMVSANISVIPEFNEKIDLDEVSNYFHKSSNDIVNTMTGSRVMFRGIHTSSGNQTAKLKSIQGITTFVVDEAEEWLNEEEFEKIMLSIRTKGLQNRVIIIMNPADSNHWVYKRFIENSHKLVDYDGVQVQISTHPNVLHIHTSYLDNLEHLSENFLKEVLAMKQNDPEKYAHIVMGKWADVAEGAVFKKWGIVEEFPSYAKKVARACDFGYVNDVSAVVRCGIVGNALYLDELCYRTQMTSGDLIREFKQEEENGDGGFIYSESADERLVDEIALAGILIYPVSKGPGSIQAGLAKMLDMEIFVTKRSTNLMNELRNYTWMKDRNGEYTNEPIDAYNHCFTADTLVMTKDGEKPIADLQIGEYALTSKGYRLISNFFNNGVKEVWERCIYAGDCCIRIKATPDHKFKTPQGWVQYKDLKVGDTLYINNKGVSECVIGRIEEVRRFDSKVFDITVEDMHEFFANGILVSNCLDASRYYVLHQILGHPIIKKKVKKADLGVY